MTNKTRKVYILKYQAGLMPQESKFTNLSDAKEFAEYYKNDTRKLSPGSSAAFYSNISITEKTEKVK